MVLTNFECWAHGSGAAGNELPFGTGTVGARHVDPFNPRAMGNTAAAPVSHISSNGYYGFSYVNAAHEANGEQNNNNNNNNRCVPNANDVNGIAAMHDGGHDVAVAATHGVFGNNSIAQRCKKRYFVSDDDYANCRLLSDCDGSANAGVVTVADLDVRAAKRCRFDDDYAAAQYCNDFFSLPSTQIGTQSCLMDTEDIQGNFQPPQQQVVDGFIMNATNFNNPITIANSSNLHFASPQQQQQQHQEHNLQQQQTLMATASSQAPPAYQHQHNYQGHLHRANRDVSRCLLSHMI